jgi:hypothetical protein
VEAETAGGFRSRGTGDCGGETALNEEGGGAREGTVVILGIVLLILGAILDISILYTIGIILVVVGAVLWLLGSMGRAVGGRRHYW